MQRLNREQVELQIYEMYQAVSDIDDDSDRGTAYEQANKVERELLEKLNRQDVMDIKAPKLFEALTGSEVTHLWRVNYLAALVKCCENKHVYKALLNTNGNDADAIDSCLKEVKNMLSGVNDILKEVY